MARTALRAGPIGGRQLALPAACPEAACVRDACRNMTIEALLAFVLLDLGFRVFGFSRVYRLVQSWSRGSATVAAPAAQRRTVRRALEAVRAATRYYYRRRLDCLPRALTLYLLLRRRGVPATLHIGVKRYPFGAHAWVECLGEVLDDTTDDWRHEPYVPIISTGSRGSKTPLPSTGAASSADGVAPRLT